MKKTPVKIELPIVRPSVPALKLSAVVFPIVLEVILRLNATPEILIPLIAPTKAAAVFVDKQLPIKLFCILTVPMLEL
jgi:hypothetical protein